MWKSKHQRLVGGFLAGGVGIALISALAGGTAQPAAATSARTESPSLGQTLKANISSVPNIQKIAGLITGSGLTLTVNGKEIGALSLAQEVSGVEQRAVQMTALCGTTPSAAESPAAVSGYVKAAVAEATVQAAAYQAAQQSGQIVSYAQANAQETSDYQKWLSMGSPAVTLPNGLTGEAAFLSPSSVDARAIADTVQNYLAAQGLVSTATPSATNCTSSGTSGTSGAVEGPSALQADNSIASWLAGTPTTVGAVGLTSPTGQPQSTTSLSVVASWLPSWYR